MHYKEEKTVLKPVKNWLKTVASVFFICGTVSAQISINGFTQVNIFNTFSGYSQIYSTDFNEDEYPDLIFYTPQRNNVIIHPSDGENHFKEPINKFFYFPISDINFFGSKGKTKLHIFVSRTERLAGLISFTKYGTLQLMNTVKFDSYPDKTIVADIDGDSKNEALVFGSAFKGLSLLSEQQYILSEKQIIKDRSFTEASFADINYDGHLDIVAKDIINNSITIFTNDNEGNFYEDRSIPVNTSFSNLSLLDFDKDNFLDIVFSNKNFIKLFRGDSVSSFSQTKLFELNEDIDQAFFDDFNKNKNIDILFSTENVGTSNLAIFDNRLGKFEITKTSELRGLRSIKLIKDFNSKLVSLSDNGKFIITRNIDSLEQAAQIFMGNSPQAITPFDYNRDGTSDLAVIDKSSLSLNLLISDSLLFQKRFRFPVVDAFESCELYDSKKTEKVFHFYSDSSRLIEVLRLDLRNNIYSSEKLYSPYPIRDLAISSDTSEIYQTISTIVENDYRQGTIIYEYKDFHYVPSQFEPLDSNIVTAKIGADNNIIQWSRNDSVYNLINYNFISGSSDTLDSFSFQNDSAEIKFIQTKIFRNKNNISSLISVNDTTTIIGFENSTITKEQLYLETKKNEIQLCPLNKILNKDGILFLLDGSNKLNKITLPNYIESERVNSYFVTHFYGKKYIVYTTDSNNLITLLRFE